MQHPAPAPRSTPAQAPRPRAKTGPARARLGLVLGPLLFCAILLIGPPEGMAAAPWTVAALTVLMALWWVTEAIPLAATALLPVAVLPTLGTASFAETASPYANPLIFLFLGGFLIALAIQRWNLHQRIALVILGLVGQRPDHLVAGFMTATAALSMWVSNTATAALMLPIGVSVLAMIEAGPTPPERARPIGTALMLGIAFGANIGGMATLIGTPPNALLAAFLAESWGIEIGFLEWMVFALPLSAVLLAACWLVLCRWAFPVPAAPVDGIADLLAERRAALGPMRGAERRVAAIFAAVALAWVLRPALVAVLPGLHLTDAAIAVLGGLALFAIPADRASRRPLLDWDDTLHLPWGVLILVGGGLSLGEAIGASGLSAHLTGLMQGLTGAPEWLLVGAVATAAMALSHVTSNTATAATLVPLAGALAISLGLSPLLLTLPVALAASCAFMLPVATPPNAIVFGSGRVSVPEMVRAGWRLSLISLALIGGGVVTLDLAGLMSAPG